MKPHFMLDIETTGIDPNKEDLLQIGVLALSYEDGFWRPGKILQIEQGCERQPESEFAKIHMKDLYARCNDLPFQSPSALRAQVTSFFKESGASGVKDTFLMGWNASNFDAPFLVNKGVLVPSTYETGPDGKDIMVGDFHYQIYEMGGAISLAMNVLGRSDRKEFIEAAYAAYPEIEMPAGKQHDALYDCYRQTRTLNGLIRLVRNSNV